MAKTRKTLKLSLLEELKNFSARCWEYQGANGPIVARRAKRTAGDQVIRFYSMRGYYLGEVFGLSVSDVDEEVIRSEWARAVS